MGTRQTEPLDLIKYVGPTLSGLRPVSHRHSSRELSAHDFKCLLGSVCNVCVFRYVVSGGSCSVEAVWHVARSQMLMYLRQKNVYIKKNTQYVIKKRYTLQYGSVYVLYYKMRTNNN